MAEGVEKFGGRHVISPDTEILGGVFFASGAIVVDIEENPDPYEDAYRMLAGKLPEGDGASPIEVGMAVSSVVRNSIRYSEENVGKVLRSEADARGLERIEREDEVGLSLFMDGGICHHQALFGASLVRLLQERRALGGRVSIEMAPLVYVHEEERHIWIQYARGENAVTVEPCNTPPVVKLEQPVAA